MAATHGHGNSDWTRDERVLALELYLGCDSSIPGPTDDRVIALSELLRSFPYHNIAARRPSFRNPDGVSFKLQNLRQVATGKGLSNSSRTDQEVWLDIGSDPERVKHLAQLIRDASAVVGEDIEVPTGR